jgi:lysylphosphatidylglycerol synthetase-like protein (DUF2156 family)
MLLTIIFTFWIYCAICWIVILALYANYRRTRIRQRRYFRKLSWSLFLRAPVIIPFIVYKSITE